MELLGIACERKPRALGIGTIFLILGNSQLDIVEMTGTMKPLLRSKVGGDIFLPRNIEQGQDVSPVAKG